MSTPPLIRLRGITRTYGEGQATVHALRGVDLDIRRGEFVAIMGPSGSGKSTCMNMLGCLDSPTAGEYLFDGLPVALLRFDPEGMLIGANRAARALIDLGALRSNYRLARELGGGKALVNAYYRSCERLGVEGRGAGRSRDVRDVGRAPGHAQGGLRCANTVFMHALH